MPRGIYDRTKRTNHRYASQPAVRSKAHQSSEGTTGTAVATTGTQGAPKPLSARIVKMIDGIRDPFVGYADALKTVNERRADFAPKFMKVFHAWQAETEDSFIAFVRVLVPDLPMERKVYIKHPASIAADNLRSLYNRLERGKAKTPAERAQAIQNKPVAPRVAFTRILAAFLPFLDASGVEQLRKVMSDQLHWTPGQINSVVADSTAAPPLVRVKAPKGVEIEHSLKLSPGPVPVIPQGETVAA